MLKQVQHDAFYYSLSKLNFPGPIKNNPANIIASSMACAAASIPPPVPKLSATATIKLITSSRQTGRKAKPMISKSPPSVSTTAAIKPQNTGAKVKPTNFVAPPNLAHISSPPINFGQP